MAIDMPYSNAAIETRYGSCDSSGSSKENPCYANGNVICNVGYGYGSGDGDTGMSGYGEGDGYAMGQGLKEGLNA